MGKKGRGKRNRSTDEPSPGSETPLLKRPTTSKTLTDFFSDIKRNSINNTMSDWKEHLESVKRDIINTLSKEISDLKSELQQLKVEQVSLKATSDQQTREIAELKAELKDARSTNNVLVHRTNDLEQYSRRESIRISGFPDNPHESAAKCEENVCNFVNDKLKLPVKITPSDIAAAHRLGGSSRHSKPRQVIVKFVSRKLRDRVIGARRVLKGSGITISEDLTKMNYQLLQRARDFNTVESAWSSYGRIICLLKNKSKVSINPQVSLDEQLKSK